MRILGAILAGGESRRFGSNKAAAVLEGRALIDWVREALAPQVDALLLCGPEGLADRPLGRLGPLAGINAALHAAQGFDAVLSVPCDAPLLPPDLRARLEAAGAPAFVEDAPVIGLWPVAMAEMLDEHLTGEDRSMRGWARRLGARGISLERPILNVNTPEDLARLAGRNG
ncbi:MULTISPECIES: molybdenum cofactor guanylyltransferase [unclassified Sphingomonas]|uniref:molybdenum cofactor guanylyltransferase n=1 Tax=unclassified Sphingomonas TaxID=196159 RepID=UPI0022B52CD9|nr:molybdenum cofactor guanylyltransferase [Sphingomonas sp. NIBR02145]WHU02910.1 molybdenum cofactor guanylyltransferase [Sphingomonas sp. NIBR02145]